MCRESVQATWFLISVQCIVHEIKKSIIIDRTKLVVSTILLKYDCRENTRTNNNIIFMRLSETMTSAGKDKSSKLCLIEKAQVLLYLFITI